MSGDPQKQFNLDPHTGIITVASGLDREVTPNYTLVVIATDQLPDQEERPVVTAKVS